MVRLHPILFDSPTFFLDSSSDLSIVLPDQTSVEQLRREIQIFGIMASESPAWCKVPIYPHHYWTIPLVVCIAPNTTSICKIGSQPSRVGVPEQARELERFN
jgi:hypothetical protein